MAQTGGCEQFRVGTRAWTECVHDQATGGGLMPWIVVIPLGVMVLGMMIGFARQFSAAGRERARAHGAAGTAGSWLIFVSFIELSIGIGSWIGDRRAPGVGGYTIAAVVLLGVGILLFVIGVFLKIKGRRRARIYHSGVPGEALIRAVHETGTMVNNQPMYAFDLDVTGQGFAPVSTRHREVVPFWFLNRVGPQTRVPVKVDPHNPTRVIFDWDAFAATTAQAAAPGIVSSLGGGAPAGVAGAEAAAGAAQALAASPEAIANAMQTARQMAGRGGSGWHVGKAIGLGVGLFVLLIVGAAFYFISQVFGQVSDTVGDATDQAAEALEQADDAFEGVGGRGTGGTKVEVGRTAKGGEPVLFSVALPEGWIDATASVPERQGPLLVDVVMKPASPSEARIVVTRSIRFLEDPAAPDADVSSVRRRIEQEYGDTLADSGLTKLSGEQALRLDIAPGADGLRSRQLAVMRGGQVLFVSVTAPASEWRPTLAVFERVLASWRWGTVSA